MSVLIAVLLVLAGSCAGDVGSSGMQTPAARNSFAGAIRFSAFAADFRNRTTFEVVGGRNTSGISETLFFTALVTIEITNSFVTAADPALLWNSVHEHLHRFSPCLPSEDTIELLVDSTAWFIGTPGSGEAFLLDVLSALSAADKEGPTELPVYRVATFLNPCASRVRWRITAPSSRRTTLYFDQFTLWNSGTTFADLLHLHSELANLFTVDANSEYCFTNTVWALASCEGFSKDTTLTRMLCCNATACAWRPAAIPQALPLQVDECMDVTFLEAELRSEPAPGGSNITWLIIAVICLALLVVGAACILFFLRRRRVLKHASLPTHSCGWSTTRKTYSIVRTLRSKQRAEEPASAPGADDQATCDGVEALKSSVQRSSERNAVDGALSPRSTPNQMTQIFTNEAFSPDEKIRVVINDVYSPHACTDDDGRGGSSTAEREATQGRNSYTSFSGNAAQEDARPASTPREPVAEPQRELPSHSPSINTAGVQQASSSSPDPLLAFMSELGQADDHHALLLQRVIGRGTFGVVYQGHWKGLPVAVKRLVLQIHASENVAAHPGLREAKLAIRLCHANIVSTYRVSVRKLQSETARSGETRPMVGELKIEGELAHSFELFMLQELCDGGPLQVAIARGVLHLHGVPQLKSILRVALDIAHGLYALHGHNIIHGDLKPENVLLCTCLARSGSTSDFPFVAKLCDFGLSFAVGSGTHVSNMHVGTPIYVAPEVRSNGHLSKAADMYSLGVVLWELFTGMSACITTDDRGTQQHPDLMRWGSPIGRQAPVSYVLLTVACLSPDRATRPSVDKALSVLADLYDYVCTSTSSREVEDPFTFADSIRSFRNATGTSVAPDTQEELAQWLHYLSSSTSSTHHEQREGSAARAALEGAATGTRSTGLDCTVSSRRWQTTCSSSCGTFLSTLSVAGTGVPSVQVVHAGDDQGGSDSAHAQLPQQQAAPDARSSTQKAETCPDR